MKKRVLAGIMAVVMSAAALTGCGGGSGSASAKSGSEFKLKNNVEFLVSSKAGGGSDIFARSITDIAASKKLVEVPFIVNNLQDGNGQISRRQVSTAKNVDNSLLCFSTGDLSAMLTNGGLTMEDFTPIAIMAADKQLLFTAKDSEYEDFNAVIEAAKAGQQIVVGGTGSDEKNVFDMLVKELGLEDQFSYIVYGSASETITALLGGHVQVGVSKPAASKEYVVSGDIVPVLALSSERFAEPFDGAPTTEELGYNVVELPVWRGVIGPKNMSAEGLAFWEDVFKQICDSDEWKTNYLEKNMLVNNYQNAEEAKATMLQTEQEVLNSLETSN